MFSIHNFEEYISKTILERGRDYYENGFVKKVKETGKGNWEARVTGTDKYEVALILKNNSDVINYDCDCPYDGDTCKHVVALLFFLQEKFTMDVTPKKTKPKKNPVNKKFSFENLLDSISLKEYKDFIGYYSTSDKNFKTNFELYFSHKDSNFNVEKTYTPLIRKLVRKYSDRGYMDYRGSRGFANEIELMIKTAYDYFTKDNFRDAFALAKVLTCEVIKPVEYCDDSSGKLGDAVSNSIDLLNEIVISNAVPFPVKEQVVDFLKEELKNSLYFDYGNYGYEMTGVFFTAAKLTANHDAFIAFVDTKIEDYKYTGFDKQFFTTQKIEFLNATGRKNEAQAAVAQNMDIAEVRAAEVEKHVEQTNYEIAKILVNEGIVIAQEKKHHGIVHNWQKKLYAIAVLENDLATMRDYAKILAFDYRFDAEYYNRWKSTYTEEEWPDVIENYIEAITNKVIEAHNKEKSDYFKTPLHIKLLDKLSDIYIHEKFTDRILKFIKTGYNLNLLLKYHTVLLAEYSTELLILYPPAIENECETANSRSDYKAIANAMKKIITTIPHSNAQIIDIAQSLIKKYPRRPAMIDEFNKI